MTVDKLLVTSVEGAQTLMVRRNAAIIYSILTALVVAFQLALALGAPWGAYAMGGANPGQLPPSLRVAAVIQALILALLACIVLARAGLLLPRWAKRSHRLVWVAVAIAAVSSVLNLITPSAGERLIWAPVALVLLISSLVVATGPKLN